MHFSELTSKVELGLLTTASHGLLAWLSCLFYQPIKLLYAAETWTLLAADVRTLEVFHNMRCQCLIFGIRGVTISGTMKLLPPIMDQ